MSIAPRETQWLSSCHWRSGHSRLGQRVKTDPSGLIVGVPQAGHSAGGTGGFARSSRSRACGAGETTCGMTSPARRTITSSPTRMSLRCRSSSLCSVALRTVTPPTCTGSSTANGCRSPNLPTFHSIPCRVVTAVVGANFQAIAQRGSRPTTPRRRCISIWSTFTTTPSISKSSAPRRSSQRGAVGDDLVLGRDHRDVGVDREIAVAQPLQRLGVALEGEAVGGADRRRPRTTAGARRSASGPAGGSRPRPSCAGS